MEPIIKNFVELLLENRINDIKFNKLVNVSYLINDELSELDKCLKKILVIFPKIYPQIVDSTNNKHRYGKIERENKKFEEIFIRSINEKDYINAAKNISMMSHTRIDESISLKIFKDEDFAEIFHELNSQLSHLTTQDEVKKDIEQFFVNCFGDNILTTTTKNNLIKLLIDEISLRIEVPDVYDLENMYRDSELLFLKLDALVTKNYLKDILHLVSKKYSSLEILNYLKTKYKIGNLNLLIESEVPTEVPLKT